MEIAIQEPGKPKRFRRVISWARNRYAMRGKYDNKVTRTASGSVAVFGTLSMAAAVMGIPTGLGTFIDLAIFLSLNLVLMYFLTKFFSLILSMLHIPLPRNLISTSLYVGVQTYIILYFAELGILMSAIIAIAYSLTGVVLGCLLGLLLRIRTTALRKTLIAVMFACVISALLIKMEWPVSADVPIREQEDDSISLAGVELLEAPDPSLPGGHEYVTFSYGSGEDKHRDIFGESTDVITSTVDASAMISNWPKLRTWYWGFDQYDLPINGRVWMPDGEGPYPLALIVHGNHLMEYFSDGGYDYLGKLLASRGIIAVSVDANFLNYSVWSGIPDDDMKVRAWLLLKHLQELKTLDSESGNLFSDRVDFTSVALIGHSRGGQAAAMAADADQWFSEDAALDSLKDVHIRSVVAIAPTDKHVDDKFAELIDVNYLTLQGARDADVNNFYGDRQYNRVSFTEDNSDLFKAAIYIADANHSQFNKDWGTMDERLPGGLFLNREDMLKADEQRQISKVYISAFLDVTLNKQRTYEPLFQDYRSGLRWLPETSYISRYEQASFIELARFDQSNRYNDVIVDSSADGMIIWEPANAEDRDGINKGTMGLELAWDEPGAEFELELSSGGLEQLENLEDRENVSLVFSMANLERDFLPLNIEEEESVVSESNNPSSTVVTDENAELPPIPEVEIELTMENGETRVVQLNELAYVTAPVYTSFTSIPYLESRIKDEKYKQSTEPVFQTFTLPIDEFELSRQSVSMDSINHNDKNISNSTGLVEEIRRITFRFISGPGKVMLDDIGFMLTK